MALDSKNNIKSVFIVNTALSPVTSGTITPGSVTTDSVVIANMSNEVLVAGSGAGTGVQNYSKIKIIKDRGANLPLQQVVLNLNDIIAYSGVAGVAAREQVSYIGYNGTTGSIAGLTANTFYEVKLEHVPNQFAYGKRPANYKYGTWKSGTTAPTQADVVTNLVKSLIQNFKPNRTIDWRVFSEVVTNATRTAVSGAGTLTFVKYSKIVTASAATATSTFVVGDYIQIAAGNSVGVYKVVDKDGTSGNLTLDVSYQGDNTTITPGTTSIRITAANATSATAWGIKITGIKQKYDVNRWRQYDKVRFNPFINEAFNTTSVTTVAALDGVGVYEQVANDEYISWGDEGQIFVDQVPPLFREQDAVVGTQYNPVVLGWLNNLPSLIGAGENKGQAILYMSGSSTIAGQGATLISVLNSWLTGKFANLPGTLV
jgi:hypothetical protein